VETTDQSQNQSRDWDPAGAGSTPLRIGNASGFYGDRASAWTEMLTGGELDVLTGDYLAELTMLILGRDRLKHPDRGYARTFLAQMETALGLAHERGVAIVSNAGGLNPAGLAEQLAGLADRLGLPTTVSYVEGDAVPVAGALTAHAYLGAFGIAECLRSGADVVVTGRVTDASLVVGPAIARFGWQRTDLAQLAGATVVGHILECGAQATGGNFSFFTELPDRARHPGFPVASVFPDGSAVITKHPETGGAVTVETVTAQLLYEIDGPEYLGPDVVTRFDTVHLRQIGPDQVRVWGAQGLPPPPTLKVGVTTLGGYRNAMTFILTGLDIEAKAALVREQLIAAVGPHRSPRRRPPGGGQRAADRPHRRPRPATGRTGVLQRGGRARPGLVPRLHADHPTRRGEPVRGLHRADRAAGGGDAHGRPTGRHPGRHRSPAGGDAVVGAPPAPNPARRRAAGGVNAPGSTRDGRGGPVGRQGWGRHARRVGPDGGGVRLVARLPHRRAPAGAAARVRAADRAPGRAAEPARDHLRPVWTPGAGRGRLDPVRPAGEGVGGVAALPPRRHSGGSAVSTRLTSRVDPRSPTFAENRAAMLDRLAELEAALDQARAGGGPRYVDRHRARGKLLARERVELLVDRDSPFLELMPVAAWGTRFPVGASVVTGIGFVRGHPCVIVANDPTVRGGAVNPYTLAKTQRASEIALANRLPLVNLVESGGADLPTQADIFVPGGRSFRDLTRLSAARIPTVAVVFGTATAGGAYLPGLSDYTIFVDGRAKVFLAGPPLVKMATGEESDDETLGGARMHATHSGLADFLAADELDALRLARDVIARVGASAAEGVRPPDPAAAPPRYDAEELLGIPSADLRVPYDPREVLARVVDGSEFVEFKPAYGTALVTGWAAVHGFPVGVLANARGVLFSEEAQKAAQFIQLANTAGTPLLFLQNTTGYMVGARYEQGGIIKHGALMINAVANSRVPHLTLNVGASYGAGNYGMCGRAYEPRFLFAWPHARSAVMGPQQLAGVMSLVARQAATAKGQPYDEATDAAMRSAVEAQIEQESAALAMSGRGYDDGVIDPRDTRTILGLCLWLVSRRPPAPVTAAAGAPLPPGAASPTGYGVFRM
jgi:acetyl-CoA carboxylase carboxyltransferase component